MASNAGGETLRPSEWMPGRLQRAERRGRRKDDEARALREANDRGG